LKCGNLNFVWDYAGNVRAIHWNGVVGSEDQMIEVIVVIVSIAMVVFIIDTASELSDAKWSKSWKEITRRPE
jgi:hypothetical protein